MDGAAKQFDVQKAHVDNGNGMHVVSTQRLTD